MAMARNRLYRAIDTDLGDRILSQPEKGKGASLTNAVNHPT